MTALKKNGIIYTSCRHGTFLDKGNGRFFADMIEKAFADLLNGIVVLEVRKQCFSSNVHSKRSEERWLNLILRKR